MGDISDLNCVLSISVSYDLKSKIVSLDILVQYLQWFSHLNIILANKFSEEGSESFREISGHMASVLTFLCRPKGRLGRGLHPAKISS